MRDNLSGGVSYYTRVTFLRIVKIQLKNKGTYIPYLKPLTYIKTTNWQKIKIYTPLFISVISC
jgi:hypothetical protein